MGFGFRSATGAECARPALPLGDAGRPPACVPAPSRGVMEEPIGGACPEPEPVKSERIVAAGADLSWVPVCDRRYKGGEIDSMTAQPRLYVAACLLIIE